MSADLALRLPPHSLEAEQAVLGGLMLDDEAWDRAAEIVREEDFYRKDHRLVFRAVGGLAAENQPRDALTVSEALRRDGLLEEAGGLGYLGELVRNTPSAANIGAYAEVVRERAQRRRLISAGYGISEAAYDPRGASALDIAGRGMSAVQEAVGTEAGGAGVASWKQVLAGCLDKIDMRFQSGSVLIGHSSGFDELDRATQGLIPGDLIIVAGRPSMGKTTFGMNLVENIVRRGGSGLVFSLEMDRDSLGMRSLSSIGGLPLGVVRSGQLGDNDWPRLTRAMGDMSGWKLSVDDSAGISPEQMRLRARQHVREHGPLSIILVDYLQLMRAPGFKADSRVAEVSEISRALKALAKEMQCPVVALSQLNRGVESRPVNNRRPVMADLRESGAIEQDADLIMFIYRDVVYSPETPHPSIAEVIIGKQRNGPLTTVLLDSQLQFSRFINLAQAPAGYGEAPPAPMRQARRPL